MWVLGKMLELLSANGGWFEIKQLLIMRVRRRPRLGWMDGVKVAFANRGLNDCEGCASIVHP